MAIPSVSILIDTYNHERFIEQAIVSVLEQDIPAAEMEVIVVDDGSTDNTPAIVRKFAPRVRYLRKANGGQASAFNAGIPLALGEVLAFLDGDDWWAPGKLSRVLDTMTVNSGIGMVGHGFVESFDDGREQVIAPHQSERLHVTSVLAAQSFRLHRCYLGTSRLALDAKIARSALPVPEVLVLEADEYLFTLAASLAEFVILSEPLTHYRIHGGNLFFAAGSSLVGLRRKQRVLAALAAELGSRLPVLGVPKDVVGCVVELIAAEATQLRLKLDGGWPWETYRTETAIYRIQHGDAPQKHKLFRQATMTLALLLPPRWFYQLRQWLSAQSWYSCVRRKLLPVPGFARTPATGPFHE